MSFVKRTSYYVSVASIAASVAQAELSLSLKELIPSCASPCVEQIIEYQYSSSCFQPYGLECLCTHYGNSGYAIYEAISGCVRSSGCDTTQQIELDSFTENCESTSNAVPPTTLLWSLSQATSLPVSQVPPTNTTSSVISSNTMSDPSPTAEVTQATVNAGPDGVKVQGQLNLTMAQIAGITIAAAALLILTVGIFSCIFFVRKRNKRLEHEDRKILMKSSPKSTTDMEDLSAMYFPPPPTAPSSQSKNGSREGSRFSVLPRKRSKELDEETFAVHRPEISAPIRTWPRYYPIMPDQNFGIGIATTTDHSQQVVPVQSPSYIPAAAPIGSTSQVRPNPPRATSPTPKFSLSRNPSTGVLPSYQPHSSYTTTVHQLPQTQQSQTFQEPPRPAAAYVSKTGPTSHNRHSSRTAGHSRRSKAFSFMTDIEESEQVSSRETSLAEMSGSSSSESLHSSSATKATVSLSMKKSRRPTLTINIPGQLRIQNEFPPPPPAKNAPQNGTSVPNVNRGPPPQPQLPRMPLSTVEPSMANKRSSKTSPPAQQLPDAVKLQMPPNLGPVQVVQQPRTPPMQQAPVITAVRTPPSQQVPRRANSNSSAPMLQALASRASQRSAARPKPALAVNTQKSVARPALALNTQKPVAIAETRPRLALETQKTTTKASGRPPLLREDQVQQIANSPSDILKAANSYARARKPSPESSTRDSMSSAALPSSTVMGPATFLLSDSERNTSSRSNSSVRRASRGNSRSARRASDASVTSFEDDSDSDDETPPKEENRSLSPVIEASPVSVLRYPKVPRQANQVVPRSPGTPKNGNQPASPSRISTPTRATNNSRPDVNTAAASALTQTIGNRLWKTELSPSGKPIRPPEWSHRRSESWEKWAQSTPDSVLQTPKPSFAINGSAPKLTPTRRGDDLFLDLRFSASTLGPVSPKRQ